jgi:3-oxoacyl-[acyl-carrier protein] reductase
MKQRSLADRVALVTGGARGIGRATCVRLAQEGVKVAVHFRQNDGAARETADKISAEGGAAGIVRADVSSPDEVSAMVAEVERELGPIELLVNNAGVLYREGDEKPTLETWRRTLDVNLTGAYLVTWAVQDGMIARGYGRIVNMASIAGLRPRPTAIAYSVSKAGLIAFTRSMAAALAPHGIRVNAVAPGLIDTDMVSNMAPDRREELIRATPISRLGEPAEIAEVVRFLLSDESSFMTGQTLVASGGRVMLP